MTDVPTIPPPWETMPADLLDIVTENVRYDGSDKERLAWVYAAAARATTEAS